jgi:hypothetical protein
MVQDNVLTMVINHQAQHAEALQTQNVTTQTHAMAQDHARIIMNNQDMPVETRELTV